MNGGDGLARWLIQHAAHQAPSELSERLQEEWLADLEVRQGLIERLRLGVGCCWATRVIAHEHCAARVPAAASATGSKIMSAFAQHDDVFFSRRTITVMLIIALHVAIFYALANGLTHQVFKGITKPIAAFFMPDPPVVRQPPPVPTVSEVPSLHNPDIPQVKAFDIPVDDLVVGDVFTGPDLNPPPTGSTEIKPSVKRTVGGPGRGFPNTEDFYPADAIRKGQQGAVTVQTCVDERGRLTAVPTIARSSGTPSLDEGALRLAKAGSGHYRATTEDGQAVSSCYQFRIAFYLKDGRS
jgi:periplasmic protein TonB